MTGPRRVRAVVLALGIVSPVCPAMAQAGPPPTRAALEEEARAALAAVASAERGFARAMDDARRAGSPSNGVPMAGLDDRSRLAAGQAQLDESRQRLRDVLDYSILETSWGGEELARLRRSYPGSHVLRVYAVRRALFDGSPEEADAELDRLLTLRPRDPSLQRLRAEVAQVRGDVAGAKRAYGLVLELDPAGETAFPELVRLHDADDSLDVLLQRLERLCLVYPDDVKLLDHRVELLHRLGRADEAYALSRGVTG